MWISRGLTARAGGVEARSGTRPQTCHLSSGRRRIGGEARPPRSGRERTIGRDTGRRLGSLSRFVGVCARLLVWVRRPAFSKISFAVRTQGRSDRISPPQRRKNLPEYARLLVHLAIRTQTLGDRHMTRISVDASNEPRLPPASPPTPQMGNGAVNPGVASCTSASTPSISSSCRQSPTTLSTLR